MADQYAKDAATGRTPRERLPEGYAEETSLAHMTRVATEARSEATTDWITEHVRPGRSYRPPPGKGVRRTQLRRVKKTLAGRYYQLLSGHAETGTHRQRFGRKDIGEALRWEWPKTPSVRYLWEGKATGAVLEFLRTTRVGCVGLGRVPPEERGEEESGEEGGPGPP